MHRIHIFPRWARNPYLSMLYVGARAEGWSIRGTKNRALLYEALPGLKAGDILHVHWTAPICQSRPTEAAARKSLDAFRTAVTQATDRGVRLIWTVHNHLPHDALYPELEVELAEFLAGTAWRIIQLNRSTRQAVSAFYDLPADKIVTLRHASYQGIYPLPPSQAQARAELGVPESAPTLGFVGHIRPYKGITNLLAAANLLAPRFDDLTVLLAGTTRSEYLAEIEQAIPDNVRVVRQHRFVPDEQVPTWFAASDLMVFPYQAILNSGSLLLSATFGRPCVLPAEPHLLSEYSGQDWVSFFDPDGVPAQHLAETIGAALPLAREHQQEALAFAAEYTTYDMTWDYVRILTEQITPATTN